MAGRFRSDSTEGTPRDEHADDLESTVDPREGVETDAFPATREDYEGADDEDEPKRDDPDDGDLVGK